MAALENILVDVAYNNPFTLKLSRRNSYGMALLDYKLQNMYRVEPNGHLSRVRADTMGVLVSSFAAAIVPSASLHYPAGPFQAGGVRPPDPAHRDLQNAHRVGTEVLPRRCGHWPRPGRGPDGSQERPR
jgi:hypothetical protein